MAPTVVLFPGQGSQKQGMAQDFHAEFALARQIFLQASEALEMDMEALCFDDDPRLHLTAFTQPAILTAEIAMFRVLQQEFGLKADYFAGHSLGEYTALVAADAIPLAQALRLVRLRGQLMQKAVPEGLGAMAALIRNDLDPEAIRAVLEGLDVDLANLNSPSQVVISGAKADVESGVERLLQAPAAQGARARMLKVSAPFHSRLMASIEPEFREALEASLATWQVEASSRVLSNTSGMLHDGSSAGLVERLTRQISGEVRWVQNMRTAVSLEPGRLLEIGPSRPLRGFFRGIDHTVDSITNLVSARRAMST
jgi:[acyl-carrier-protein] S-malonyltransferase/trans-AT polyketide synthase/acyltransferase/oxidoreductase domain-containing protein